MRHTKTAGSVTRRQRRSCFVLMPFRPDLDELYSKTIRPAIEKSSRFRVFRADEIYGANAIIADIWDSIQKSEVVVADVTGRNPNVFYELGLAHASSKPVVILTQRIDDVPFDLKHLRVIVYENTALGRQRLQKSLQETMAADNSRWRPFFVPAPSVEEVSRPDKERRNPVRLAAQVASSDPAISVTAMEQLARSDRSPRPGDRDPRVLAALIKQLRSEYPEVQLAAIEALQHVGKEIHSVSLLGLLSNPNLVIVAARRVAHLARLMLQPPCQRF